MYLHISLFIIHLYYLQNFTCFGGFSFDSCLTVQFYFDFKLFPLFLLTLLHVQSPVLCLDRNKCFACFFIRRVQRQVNFMFVPVYFSEFRLLLLTGGILLKHFNTGYQMVVVVDGNLCVYVGFLSPFFHLQFLCTD